MSAPKRFLTQKIPSPNSPVVLDSDEAHHAIKVLRLEDGDPVFAVDGLGKGSPGTIRIKRLSNKTEVLIESAGIAVSEVPGSIFPIHMSIAILKGDAMDWCIEKCVELGVSSITPLETDHTVVQIKKKGGESFQSRWQTLSDQSLKQCERLTRMIIQPPVSLEEHLAQMGQTEMFWLSERSNTPQTLSKMTSLRSGNIHILSGPEGGWSANEKSLLSRSKNITPVSLSPLILRGETAVVSSASIVAEVLRSR